MASLGSFQFFGSLLGQRMMAHERLWLKNQLRTCVGTHALLLTSDPFVRCKPLFSDFYMLLDISNQVRDDASVCATFDALPLPNASMDVVVVQHVLSSMDNAINVLREAERVLVPGGRLFVINENPYSLFGLRLVFSREQQWLRTVNRLYSAHRICEWLAALDVPVQNWKTLFHEVPIQHAGLLQRTRRLGVWLTRNHMPFGGVYCLAAIKTARPVNPIRQKKMVWQPTMPTAQIAKTRATKQSNKDN